MKILQILWKNIKIFYKSLYYKITIFHILIILGAIIIFTSLWYSGKLINRLKKEETRRVKFYGEVIKYITSENNCEVNFLFEHVLRKNEGEADLISVPAIITDENFNIIHHNFEHISKWPKEKQQKFLQKELQKMKESGIPPIKIEYLPGKFNYVFYRESETLQKLKKYPYFVISAITFLVVILGISFYLIRKTEENRLWMALSKETAHQLGTPISGLNGWIELLKLSANQETKHYVTEMEKDVEKLMLITERFSKIGSKPELQPMNINKIIQETANYILTRSSKNNIQFELNCEIPENITVYGSPTLFSWVIENLLKNSIDALKHKKQGKISINCSCSNNWINIDISDTGKGIPHNQKNKIFKAGFTTKKRGWGIGLNLAKRIIEQYHKGKIFLKFTEENVGTTFRIKLKIHKK